VASTALDGRTARARRTRESVVRALLDLVREGNPRPTAKEIAERAGVSLRSVYVHFDDLDDLFAAAVRRHVRDTAAFSEPIDATLPLPERVAAFARQRATLFDQFGAVRRAANQWAPTSSALAHALERGQQVAWSDTVRLFGAEIGPGPRHDLRLEAINAAGSAATWDQLRLDRGLTFEQARAVVEVSVTSILAPDPEEAD
jgi:AcrR family transcriptional regulator